MKEKFEVMHKDVMGRIGKLYTPHGTVETPTLMPVINPNIDFIPTKKMREFGTEIVITNSYIIYRTPELRNRAIEKGVHALIESDLPVMTDSGSYQLMVYGDVEITNTAIVEFQNKIKSDIVVPLDIPSLPDVDRLKAEEDLRITLEREREAITLHSEIGNGRLISAPIQGSTYLDLRRKSAEEASRLGADFYPIGGVVPLMDEYRFLDVVQIILEVKSVLPPSAPVHLFGAGHPMIFAMAVALGCDFFDSAAYALYAKDDRYLTVYGTKKLEELHYFPCSCPVCSEYMPAELRKIQKDERELIIAEHNLYASFEEIRTIKQAIREKSLFELVESRIRGHPYLVSGWRQIRKYGRILELYDPSSKQGFFHTGIEGNYRPAVTRHHERVLNVELDLKDIYVISTDESGKADFYLKPAFGVVPATISEIYPAGHAEMPEEVEIESILTGIKGLINFLNHHSDKKFRLYIDEVWDECLKTYNLKLPDNVQIEKLRE